MMVSNKKGAPALSPFLTLIFARYSPMLVARGMNQANGPASGFAIPDWALLNSGVR